MSRLHEAVKAGKIEDVRQFLADGFDPNEYNEYGETVLSEAVGASLRNNLNDYLPVIDLLLEKGANINALGIKGQKRSVLHWAAEARVPELIDFLLKRDANVHSRTTFQDTPLHLAMSESRVTANEQNMIQSVELLLKYGASPEATNELGWKTYQGVDRNSKLYSLLSEYGVSGEKSKDELFLDDLLSPLLFFIPRQLMTTILENEQINLDLPLKIFNAKNLSQLSIAGIDPNLDDNQKKYLTWALKNLFVEKTSLKVLGLNNVPGSVIDILSTGLLDPKCSIKEIHLSSLLSESVVKLREILKNPSCKVTNLGLGSLDENVVRAAGDLLKDPSCKVTNLELRSLDENAVRAAGDFLKDPSCKVTTLVLHSLNENAVRAAGDLLKDPSCKVTNLELRSLDEKAVRVAGDLLKDPNSKVTTLVLRSLDENAVRAAGDLLKDPNSKVTQLVLHSLDENAVRAAGDLLKDPNSKVTQLVLRSLDESAVRAAGDLLKDPNSKVTQLVLHSLDENAVRAAGDLLKDPNSKVTQLVLRSLDESAVRAAGDLLKDPSCKVTTLVLHSLDEKGVRAAGDLLKDPSCKVITLVLRSLDENAVRAAGDLLKGLSRKILVKSFVNLRPQAEEMNSLNAKGITILDMNSNQASISHPSSSSSSVAQPNNKRKSENESEDALDKKRARLDATPQLPSSIQASANTHSSIHHPNPNRMSEREQTSLTPPHTPFTSPSSSFSSSSINSPIGTPVNFFRPAAIGPTSLPLPPMQTFVPTACLASSISPSTSTVQNQGSSYSSASSITGSSNPSLAAGNGMTNLRIHSLEGSAFSVNQEQRLRPEAKIKEEPMSEDYHPH